MEVVELEANNYLILSMAIKVVELEANEYAIVSMAVKVGDGEANDYLMLSMAVEVVELEANDYLRFLRPSTKMSPSVLIPLYVEVIDLNLLDSN
eukprot:scaffold38219_cov278-Skeletonema_dohrnii-CCMP3373.AAC.1